MNQPTPQGKEPKMSRLDAEAMIKLMEQELAIQRAKLAVDKAKGGATTARWAALVVILLALLGAIIWGFAKLQEVKLETPIRSATPPPAPARR